MMDPGRRCPCSCWQRGRSPACGPHPAIPPPRQPFRSRTSHYQPSLAAQSSSASPPAPRRPACRVSAAYHAALARGGAQRRAGSCGRPGRWARRFCAPLAPGAEPELWLRSKPRTSPSQRSRPCPYPTTGEVGVCGLERHARKGDCMCSGAICNCTIAGRQQGQLNFAGKAYLIRSGATPSAVAE